jgi:hypothetical protein
MPNKFEDKPIIPSLIPIFPGVNEKTMEKATNALISINFG